MNLLIISSCALALMVALGALLAGVMMIFSRAVTGQAAAIEAEKSQYNPSVTKGHKIPVAAEFDDQLKAARRLAAKYAAAVQRGANLGIGSVGQRAQPTSFDGTDRDPVTAVRIAQFHGWRILKTGAAAAMASTAPAAAPAQASAAAPSATAELVPGRDFPYIEVTETMDPAEVRKARIANAKAKAAAEKARKEVAGGPVGAPGDVPAQMARELPLPAAGAAGPAGAVEPVPGVHYQEIEIRPDMSPDEVRKARIANAKAKSAAAKALKESGAAVEPAPTRATPEPEVQAAVAGPAAGGRGAPPPGIPRPEYVEIREDMDPAQIRAARIQNAKAKSAYQKALKEAGIDPASVGE
jgi:hypothetical protein